MQGKPIAARLLVLATLPVLTGCQADAPPAEQQEAAAETVTFPPDGEFPEAFRGRWGVSPGDCKAGGGGSEMFVEVEAKHLRMSDRNATVDSLTVETPTRLIADLGFSGQGLEWPRQSRFYLENDGNTLVRADQNPVVNFTYTRCAR